MSVRCGGVCDVEELAEVRGQAERHLELPAPTDGLERQVRVGLRQSRKMSRRRMRMRRAVDEEEREEEEAEEDEEFWKCV